MRFQSPRALALASIALLAGCAALPQDRGYAQTRSLLDDRQAATPAWPSDDAAALSSAEAGPLPSEPLSTEHAVRLAFIHNPRIRELYARLGLGRAELDEARRIANPGFGFSRLRPDDGHGSQITRSLSLSFTDLLLLPARKRFAEGELQRIQHEVASELLELGFEVESAWYHAVSAAQIASMRELVSEAASASAELAQRFFDAGNISRLQLEHELAAASQARIAAVRASAEALHARSELASAIGLALDGDWQPGSQLPAPLNDFFYPDRLVPWALRQRLDLAAAQQAVALREDALGVTRRWRWLGEVELGYERESELDGGVMRGPSLALQLPLFNQGQPAIARARAELIEARAQLDTLALSVRNQARLGVERLKVSQQIVDAYRDTLLPRSEAVVARSQEEVNFMLMGVFELILAKQEQYDAYQEYLEAVRDYWIARADLRRVVGGRLPGDEAAPEPSIGVEAILPAASAPMDHSGHGMHKDSGDDAGGDPHAAHRPAAAEHTTPASDVTPAHSHHGDTP